jgi:lipocalin
MIQVPIARQLLQNAATTGAGLAVDLGGITRELAFHVIWSAGVNAGQVKMETAFDVSYTGTWAPIATADFVASTVQVVQATGAYRAVRARISTTVTGGTVDVRLDAN